MRGRSHAGLWTLALAGSLALHGAVALALAAIPARQDKPPPPTRIAFETPPAAETVGVSPAETIAPAAPEALASVSPEAEPLSPTETAPVPVEAAVAPSPATPASVAPVAAATEDVAALRPVEVEAAELRTDAPSALAPVRDQAAEATDELSDTLSPVEVNEAAAQAGTSEAAAPVETAREVVEPAVVPDPLAAVSIADDTALAVAMPEEAPAVAPVETADAAPPATADSAAPAAEEQIVSLPVAGGEIPVGAIVVPEAVTATRDEPAAVTVTGSDIVAALASEDTPPLVTPPSAAPPPLALQPLVSVTAPSTATAPTIVQPVAPASVAESVAQDAAASSRPAETLTAAREPSLVINGASPETAVSTVLAPIEDESEATSPEPGGAQNSSATNDGMQLAAALPRPAPQAPPAPGPTRPMPIAAFLKGYESDACVLALPTGDGAVEAFADSPDKTERLRVAYQREAGQPLAVEPHQVSAAQCGALSFSRSLAQYPNYPLKLSLEASAIDSGEALSGRVEGVRRNTLYLLVVDDEGQKRLVKTYQGVTKLSVPFSEPMVLKNRTDAPVQLLVAIGANGPLDALATPDGTLADGFFDDLAWEIVSEGHRISFGIAGFVVR